MPNIKLTTSKQVALQTDELLFIDRDTTLERQVENGNIAGMVFESSEREYYPIGVQYEPDNGEFENHLGYAVAEVERTAVDKFNYQVSFHLEKKLLRIDYEYCNDYDTVCEEEDVATEHLLLGHNTPQMLLHSPPSGETITETNTPKQRNQKRSVDAAAHPDNSSAVTTGKKSTRKKSTQTKTQEVSTMCKTDTKLNTTCSLEQQVSSSPVAVTESTTSAAIPPNNTHSNKVKENPKRGRPLYTYTVAIQIESLTPFTESTLTKLYNVFYSVFHGYIFEYVIGDKFIEPWIILKNDVCTHPNKTAGDLTSMQHNGSSVPCRVFKCNDRGEEFFKPLTLLA